MKKNVFILAALTVVFCYAAKAQTYSLNEVTEEQFASGGTDVWSFERHDVNGGTYTQFTTYGNSSTAVNYYDQYITERFHLYPIMNRPESGTQYEPKRNAWYSDPAEFVYVAAEYPDGTTIGNNLVYGQNYPDSLTGYEAYSTHTGVNAAVTFSAPQTGYYKATMKVIRQDTWSGIGNMRVYQFFRYGGEGAGYSMGRDFEYGKGQAIDAIAAGNELIYAEYLARIPESPQVTANSGKPFRGLPTEIGSGYFYFYAKESDKISFETDARSTGNGENTPRGAYARTKWMDLTVSAVDESTATGDASFVNPYDDDPALLDQLYDVFTVAEEIINDHPEYSKASRDALEDLYTQISLRLDAGAVKSMEIPSLITQLERAIALCRASEGGLKVHYDFSNVQDGIVPDLSGGENNGILKNNATIRTVGDFNVLSLGSDNGYLDMGANIGSVVSGMNDFTISAYYRVDTDAPFSGNGFMLFAFSTMEANSQSAGEYIFYRMPTQSYSISSSGWGSSSSLTVDQAAAKGEWQHLVVQQKDTLCTIYVNGVAVKSGKMTSPSEKFTISTPYNWIGRPPFSGDNYLKQTLVCDFRLYNYAVSESEITEWAEVVADLEYATNFGEAGDFSEIASFVAEYEAFLATASIGDGAGQYSQANANVFIAAIEEAKALIAENTASQFLIDTKIGVLKQAYTTFIASVNVLTNTLEEGEYYLMINDFYVTNPGVGTIANGSAPSVINGGLVTEKASDNTQVFTLSKVTALEPFRYSIYSAYAEYIDESQVFRHLTENGVFQSSWGSSDDNWRTFNLLHNGTKYAVQCAGSAVSSGKKGYWRYDESKDALGVTDNTGSPSFIFNFIPADGSSIAQLTASSTIRVLPGAKSILVSSEEGLVRVSVYALTGALVAERTIVDNGSIAVPSGLYIVKAIGQSSLVTKVIVK